MRKRSSTTPMLAAALLVLAATAVVAFVVRPTPASVAEGQELTADTVAGTVSPETASPSASPSPSPSVSPSPKPSPKPSATATQKPGAKPTPMMTAASKHAARRVGVPILCYHHISAPGGSSPELHVSPSAFARQMASLKAKGYHAVTLRQVFDFWAYNKPIPKKPIVITFDDGWRTVYTGAAPVLKRYGWPGVVNEVVWAVDANYGMTQGQLLRLVKRGWEMNSHTVSHKMLSGLSWSALMVELSSSRKRLSHKLHTTIDFLCYPGGDYNATVIKGVREAGYKGALSIWGGLGRWQERWALRRIMATESGFTIPSH